MTKITTSLASVALMFGVVGMSSVAGAATVCVNPNSASCESTIQDGIDAAATGDSVKISRGVYYENVTISTDGVTLRGGSSTILDPTFPGNCSVTVATQCYNSGDCPGVEACQNVGDGNGITISADNVAVKGFTVRNGDDHSIEITTGAVGTEITKMTFNSPASDCVYATGTSVGPTTIAGNTFMGCDSDCIRLSGTWDAANISKNKMNQCNGYGIDHDGDDAIIEKNVLNNVDGTGIYLNGDRAEIIGNRLMNTYDEGVYISSGDDALVEGNRMEHISDSGVYVNGDNATINKNQIKNVADDYAIDFSGIGAEITKNSIVGSEQSGIDVNCNSPCDTGVLIEGNTLTNVGYDDYEGIDVFANPGTAAVDIVKNKLTNVGYRGIDYRAGAGASSAMIVNNSIRNAGRGGDSCMDLADPDLTSFTIEGNSLRNCGEQGMEVSGTGHTIYKNKINTVGGGGIELGGSSVNVNVDSNTIVGAAENGVEIESGATGAVVQDNTLKKNRLDICDEGTGSTLSGNKPASELTTDTQLCADIF